MTARGLSDTISDWENDLSRFKIIAADEAEQKRLGFKKMSKGWAIGTSGWRSALAKDYAQVVLTGMSHEEAAQIRTAKWERIWLETLSTWNLTKKATGKDALTKVNVQQRLKVAIDLRASGAPYRWIAEHLALGKPEALRIRLYRARNVTM